MIVVVALYLEAARHRVIRWLIDDARRKAEPEIEPRQFGVAAELGDGLIGRATVEARYAEAGRAVDHAAGAEPAAADRG